MSFGLTDKEINAILAVLSAHEEVKKVIVYGSRAIGIYKPSSDIDLILFGDQLSVDILSKIESELDDLLLPYKIDINIYQRINNKNLIDNINKAGKVLYNKEHV